MDLEDAYTLATQLLDKHGLDGWRVEFDNAKRRAGVCRHGRRTIGLSMALTRLHPAAEVRETILHEIAHALVGAQHGHDAVWVAKAREIGGKGERCVPSDAPTVAAPWLGVCPAGHVKERHRRPERVQSCGRCSATFSREHLLEWTYDGRPAQMHPNYVAELRALEQGTPQRLLGPGSRARIIAPGQFEGRVGVVVKRARTSYHVRLPEGLVRVVFAGAEPADQPSAVR
ncbi:MAG: SprT-like domain-containing protein [Nocardioidaceae bacterium]